ncbi:1-propanol dehydrogenase PduQ [Vagococcus hydrophili]|uniref:Iron-containing alcohol dehydrogenase n=1 Tax=Vagococcus hydrophili TaxID=2714947 RepID=A0A6G8AUH4_9ENTE|nr:1-propanol dehydrogenase PduQ [Vagococcus hydrophili]QIL48619.1 iron-containing alcohol dehydrogenase [Vagococcus hydrophili]
MKQIKFSTEIYMGSDALSFLGTFENERICIVTDKFMVESGMIDYVISEINDSNAYEAFMDIVPDPTIENVVSGVEKLAEFKPTQIIGFGGGSAIDASKAIKLMGVELGLIEAAKLIIIPTTSGTGSEVTNFSVITNKKENLKYPLVDDRLQPEVAILDPRLVKSVPPVITADTGMDVLTHALEAYVSTEATVFSDALAEKAVELIFNYLERAYKNGEDMEAREQVHYASCLAGLAFNQASLGLCHGIAHTIGGKLHLAHGRINGVLLPSIVQYNGNESQRALERYALLAKKQGLSNSRGKMGVRNLINEITSLRSKLNMPSNFIEAGLTKEDVAPFISQISEQALLDPTTKTNPKAPTVEDVRKIVTNLF